MRYRSLLCMALMLTLGVAWSASVRADLKPVDEEKDKPAEAKKRRPRGERPGKPAPKVGEVAPLFKLHVLDSEKVVDLKGFAGKRPVLLFFGSYT